MFDYKAKPFHLTDEEAKWVEDTYESGRKNWTTVLPNRIYKR